MYSTTGEPEAEYPYGEKIVCADEYLPIKDPAAEPAMNAIARKAKPDADVSAAGLL
jgi:hypothetical protein